MSTRKGLTWSKKWHIVDETASRENEHYDTSLCGAYLYNAEKERGRYGNAKMPERLQRIIDGTAKSAGDCKRCNKTAGRKSVAELLDDEDMAVKIGQLIYDRSQMAHGDADDLAWDILSLIEEQAEQS